MRKADFRQNLNCRSATLIVSKQAILISRISYDVDTINTSLASDAIQVLSSLVTIIGSFIMMLLISSARL